MTLIKKKKLQHSIFWEIELSLLVMLSDFRSPGFVGVGNKQCTWYRNRANPLDVPHGFLQASWLTVSEASIFQVPLERPDTLKTTPHVYSNTLMLGCLQKAVWTNTDFCPK